jgi:MFS family permease
MTAPALPDDPRTANASPRFTNLAAVFALLYFTQGIAEPTEGLIAQPIRSLLKDRGFDATAIGLFAAVISIPWMIKPLYGLISDFIPILGSRRRNYLLLTLATAAISLISMGLGPVRDKLSFFNLMGLLLLPTLAIAFSDVVIDAVMIEEGQPRHWTGRLQSVQWVAMSVASVLTGIGGGWLSEHNYEAEALMICGGLTACGWLVVWLWVREPLRIESIRSDELGHWSQLRAVMSDRSLWTVAAFLVMWNFNPFASNVLQEHMTGHWKWSETFFGETMSWQAVGWIIGGLIYAPCSRRMSTGGLFHASIATGVVATLLFLGIVSPMTARAASLLTGVAYMFGSLATLDLAARTCRPELAATTFAVLMSLSNVSLSGSIAVGGAIYESIQSQWSAQAAYACLVALGAATTALCWILSPAIRRTAARLESQPPH